MFLMHSYFNYRLQLGPTCARDCETCFSPPPALDRSTLPTLPVRRPDTERREPSSPARRKHLSWFPAHNRRTRWLIKSQSRSRRRLNISSAQLYWTAAPRPQYNRPSVQKTRWWGHWPSGFRPCQLLVGTDNVVEVPKRRLATAPRRQLPVCCILRRQRFRRQRPFLLLPVGSQWRTDSAGSTLRHSIAFCWLIRNIRYHTTALYWHHALKQLNDSQLPVLRGQNCKIKTKKPKKNLYEWKTKKFCVTTCMCTLC